MKRKTESPVRLEDLEAEIFPFMSKDALERYARVKVTHPQVAVQGIIACAPIAQAKEHISDARFKETLRIILKDNGNEHNSSKKA